MFSEEFRLETKVLKNHVFLYTITNLVSGVNQIVHLWCYYNSFLFLLFNGVALSLFLSLNALSI